MREGRKEGRKEGDREARREAGKQGGRQDDRWCLARQGGGVLPVSMQPGETRT